MVLPLIYDIQYLNDGDTVWYIIVLWYCSYYAFYQYFFVSSVQKHFDNMIVNVFHTIMLGFHCVRYCYSGLRPSFFVYFL